LPSGALKSFVAAQTVAASLKNQQELVIIREKRKDF
jgi:hypothetical protein